MTKPTPILLVNGERIIVIGKAHALIESHSSPGQWHSVSYENGVWSCTCPSGSIRKRCRHITTIRGWYSGNLPATVEEEQ